MVSWCHGVLVSRCHGVCVLRCAHWFPWLQVYLSYNNVSALKVLAARKNWRLSSEKDQVRLSTMEQNSTLSFRVETCDLIHRVDDDDFLYRVVTPSVSDGAVGSPPSAHRGDGVLQDFILLASKRRPCGSGDPYVIALRSVSLPTHPPTEDFHRGEVLCAGFTILPTSSRKSLVHVHVGKQVPGTCSCW
ncbi:Acyl-coenzyme A thioesterase 11 [Liparis tanakae]|uniref:Acyl-coenzyme A thioesterase 11 n=1 Tax=Liparis tanakae TaxID=230148 RepID=A0A4Z2E9N0_9TELE|nr:Acyl-coenzyme A thioesterase 11 [Liparis tanakae]